jgi:serine/threonine-protein kinase RsbW
MTERQIRIAGVLEEVAKACAFVAQEAQNAGLDDQACHHCYLAVDEACTNIVEHGYGETVTVGAIDVICRHERDQFVITILDDSPAFDPLAMPEPDVKAPLTHLEPGGWGIFFIKKLMDRVDYSYESSRNRLVMMKRVTLNPHPAPSTPEPEAYPVRAAEIRPKTWMIAPGGKLDAVQSRELAAVLGRLLDDGHKWLLLDMSEVDYISSAGFKALVSAWQRARDLKGDLVLVTLKPRVREVLEMIGLDLVFYIADTPDKALARLVSKKS